MIDVGIKLLWTSNLFSIYSIFRKWFGVLVVSPCLMLIAYFGSVGHFTTTQRWEIGVENTDRICHMRNVMSMESLMTTLDQLRKNHISIECKCGYSVLSLITELLNYVKPETTLEQVSHIARCTRCQRKERLIFGCTMCVGYFLRL